MLAKIISITGLMIVCTICGFYWAYHEASWWWMLGQGVALFISCDAVRSSWRKHEDT